MKWILRTVFVLLLVLAISSLGAITFTEPTVKPPQGHNDPRTPPCVAAWILATVFGVVCIIYEDAHKEK
jgi:hypothetical protein